MTKRADHAGILSFARSCALILSLTLAGCGGGGSSGEGGVAPPGLQANSAASTSFGSYAAAVAADAALAHFRLDDPSGNVAANLGSVKVAGTYRNAVSLGARSLLAGDADTSANFAGGSVFVPGDNGFMPKNAISLEAWIKPTNAAIQSNLVKIVANGRAWQAPYESYTLTLRSGKPSFGLVLNNAPVVLTAPSGFKADETHHLVGVYDGSTMKLYVDGKVAASQNASGAIGHYTGDGLGIGADMAGQFVFRGVIDEVAIYGAALSPNRILVHEQNAGFGAPYDTAVLKNAPVGYYRLNESGGSTVFDLSSTNQNGAYGKNVAPGAFGLFGGTQSSANFQGGFVSIPRNAAFFPGGALSVEAVVKPTHNTNAADVAKILSAGTPWTAPYDSYVLSLRKGRPSFRIATNAGSFEALSDDALADDGVYHLAATYDGARVTLYVNGRTADVQPASGAIYASSGTGLGIGADTQGQYAYRGLIGNVAIYAASLGDANVGAHAALLGNLSDVAQARSTPSPVKIVGGAVNQVVGSVLATPEPGGIVFTEPTVNLLGLSASKTVGVSQNGGTNGFYLKSTTCAGVANVTMQGNQITVVPRAAGSCAARVANQGGQTATLNIAVTLTGFSGS